MWRPRSLRVRYTLRALFVFVTLFSLWCGYEAQRAARERCAELVLLSRGAKLQCGYRPPRPCSGWDELYAAYVALRRFLWREPQIREVELVDLDAESARALCQLPYLTSLSLTAPEPPESKHWTFEQSRAPYRVAPAGAFESILACHKLKVLRLDGWILEDAALAALGQQRSLSNLTCQRINLSEKAFCELITLPHLYSAYFIGCPATGVMLSGAPASHSLRYVMCVQMPIGPEFKDFLSRCPYVEEWNRNMIETMSRSYIKGGHRRMRIKQDVPHGELAIA